MDMGAIQTDQRNGNLHLRLHGPFSGQTALELSRLIARHYQGEGNIFIHTKHVTTIEPQSKDILEHQVQRLGLPCQHLYLTGKKGLEISPDQCRVIVYEQKKQGCCGRCRNCSCKRGAHRQGC